MNTHHFYDYLFNHLFSRQTIHLCVTERTFCLFVAVVVLLCGQTKNRWATRLGKIRMKNNERHNTNLPEPALRTRTTTTTYAMLHRCLVLTMIFSLCQAFVANFSILTPESEICECVSVGLLETCPCGARKQNNNKHTYIYMNIQIHTRIFYIKNT